ncbi:hypothetical protein VPH35_029788 [Triticum aestivum]
MRPLQSKVAGAVRPELGGRDEVSGKSNASCAASAASATPPRPATLWGEHHRNLFPPHKFSASLARSSCDQPSLIAILQRDAIRRFAEKTEVQCIRPSIHHLSHC